MNIDFVNQKIGTSQDWKWGFITRTITRNSQDSFDIDEFVDGWSTATVDLETLLKLQRGEISFLEIDFE